MRLSIIIPTLNEVGYLAATVDAARRRARRPLPEIIVADCGSTDGTAELARRLGVTLCSGPLLNCRAAALNHGAAVADGDVVLFLDADTRPPRDYDRAIERALGRRRVVGGAFEFALDGAAIGLRLVEVVNRVRYRNWRDYYGDQGIFARADVFRRMGGYPARRLMEASEFSVRLAHHGEVVLLRPRMTTSARRFVEGGIYRVLARDARLWWHDLRHRSVEPFAAEYLDNNRNRGLTMRPPRTPAGSGAHPDRRA
jgi:rSAM/selenodomain-associated transferase 2